LYGSVRFLGVAFGPPIFSWLMKISHKTVFFSVAGLSFVILLSTFFFIKPGARNQGGAAKEHGPGTLFRKSEKAPT